MATPTPSKGAAAADPLPALTLTAEMRRATRRAHHAANALILAKLAVALNDRVTYGRALGSFHPVYSALEDLLRQHASHAVLGPVAEAALPLARAGAMEEDLDFLVGSGGLVGLGAAAGAGGGRPAVGGWRWAAASSESAQAYAAHLRALAEEDPALLIPYAFSLYVPVALGFLGKRVAAGLGVPAPGAGAGANAAAAAAASAAAAAVSKKTDGDKASAASAPPLPSAGVRFFDLPATAGVEGGPALARLRAAVDAAGEKLSPALRSRVVAQSLEQFRRNNLVVREFPLGARDVWRAALRARVVLALGVAVLALAAAAAAGGWLWR